MWKSRLVFAFVACYASAAYSSDALSPALQQCGVGKLKAYGMFTVGSAASYRASCKASAASDMNNPWRIVFDYSTAIPKRAFVESSEEMLMRNGVEVTPAIKAFIANYQDIEEGDRYQLELNNNTLTLSLNDKVLSRLEGADAAHYLAIWFGHKPFDKKLKKDLLGTD